MNRRAGIIGLNVALTVMGLAVLALGWQMLQRMQVTPIVAQQAVSVADKYPAASDIYQVEIRNGAGVKGAAQVLRSFLIEKGYDVVEVGNHPSFDVEKTEVVDRVGNLDIAREVAASLGLAKDRVREEERREYYLDASVIIGKDYLTLPPFADAAATAQQE